MSVWPSVKARRVRRALERIGWHDDPNDSKGSSHQQLFYARLGSFIWAFADSDEIGPKMLARISKRRASSRRIFSAITEPAHALPHAITEAAQKKPRFPSRVPFRDQDLH